MKRLLLVAIFFALIMSPVLANVNDYNASLVLLMHSNQTAGHNTYFYDSSSYNRTVTVGGNAVTVASTKKLGNASAYFDGSGDYLQVPDSSTLELGSDSYTISVWVNSSSTSRIDWILNKAALTKPTPFGILTNGGKYLYYASSGTGTCTYVISGPEIGAIQANVWQQIVVIKNATYTDAYLNGVRGSGFPISTPPTICDVDTPLAIGAHYTGTDPYLGYIDELAIWKGASIPISDLYPQSKEVGYTFTADFTQVPNPSLVDQSVQFTDTSTGLPATWNWTFGDGNTSTLQNPTNSFPGTGEYVVMSNVTDSYGDWSNISHNHTVSTATTPLAMFTKNFWVIIFPRPILFNDTSLNSPTAWNWSFGDGTYSEIQNASHQYVKRGRWVVSLNASNVAGYNTNTTTVWILGG